MGDSEIADLPSMLKVRSVPWGVVSLTFFPFVSISAMRAVRSFIIFKSSTVRDRHLQVTLSLFSWVYPRKPHLHTFKYFSLSSSPLDL